MSATTLVSELLCPKCGHRDALTMPENACVAFHDCSHCGALLRPKPGDCCVCCSYGSVPCPPIQTGTPKDQVTCRPIERRDG